MVVVGSLCERYSEDTTEFYVEIYESVVSVCF